MLCKINTFTEDNFPNNGKGSKSQNKIVTINHLIDLICVCRIETPKSASEFNMTISYPL